jgi:biopolymer transport protein ExbD
MIVLRISGDDGVELNGVKLRSTNEVAEALEKIRSENSNVTVSVEASDPIYYESIGKAIYGSHRAGFSGERFRLLIDGKPDMPPAEYVERF